MLQLWLLIDCFNVQRIDRGCSEPECSSVRRYMHNSSVIARHRQNQQCTTLRPGSLDFTGIHRLATAMSYNDYSCFRITVDSGIAHVVLDYPPLNLLDEVMSKEFDQLTQQAGS
ncbi:hypothetical protein MRB53_039353 [Persea americana]|nr:hypothetical protein MRB53_039353 [Persea americana]